MNWNEYVACKRVNFSTLKLMKQSPLHYLEAITNGRPDTTSLIKLRATHTAVLEPEKFADTHPVFPGKRRAGKIWDAFEESHPDTASLTQPEYDLCMRQRDAILGNPIVREYLLKAECELTITWTDKTTGIECKGRIDAVSLSRPAKIDLKAGTTDARLMSKLAARLGHHNQAAFYDDGCEQARGQPNVMITYEPKPPFDVAVFRWREEDIQIGRDENIALLQRVSECRKTGIWPGRYSEEQLFELPPYLAAEETAEEFEDAETGTGEGL